MTRRDWTVSLRHMLDHAREAVELASERTRDDLRGDRILGLAMTRLVEIIGEAANRLPAEERSKYPGIEWSQIIGMRNRLIHAYDQVELDIVWQTATVDLPPLIEELQRILSPLD